MTVEIIPGVRCATGESPVWHAAERAWYWVDIPARTVHRLGDDGHACWTLPEMVACLAPARSGWVAGMESGIFRVHLPQGAAARCEPLAPVRHPAGGMRFNDGRCDRQGRMWAGTMVMDMALASSLGGLYRLDQRGLQLELQGLITPNGLAFSPDGRTMYLSDSHPSVQAIWAFDYDTHSGTPSNRRLFVDMKPLPGRPDGAAVDADGCYWICGNDAGLVHRFTPDGRLDRSIAVPFAKPAMCSFGGAGLDELLVTSIRPAQPIAGYDDALAGAVLLLRPGVRGLAETPFAHGAQEQPA